MTQSALTATATPYHDLPQHATIESLHFDDERAVIHLVLDGQACEVAAEDVCGIHAARLQHEEIAASHYRDMAEEFSKMSVTFGHANTYTPLLALNVGSREEVLHLALDRFNYRKALGKEAALTTALNLPRLLQKLATFCPRARADAGFAAALRGETLPVAESLLEFLIRAKSVPEEENPGQQMKPQTE